MFKNMSEKTAKTFLMIVSGLLCVSLILNILYFSGKLQPAAGSAAEDAEEVVPGDFSKEGYTLEQVVVMSRHNIRSPLSGNGSVLDELTPYTWYEWSSNPSDLSLRGGALETMMGQYFRKWLENEELIPENYHPEEGEVRFYANSKQRTIATAEFFKTGMMPTANVQIETHGEFDQMNPVFTPALTFDSDEYRKDVADQVEEIYGEAMRNLKPNYDLISDVINIKESASYKDGSFTGFDPEDFELILELNDEPKMKGALKTGCSISDALVLQYYEEKDAVKAAFGHELTDEQWRMISDIKDTYNDVLFTTPLVAVNVAHPLVSLIKEELETDGRVFTFLCGHDSNIGSILAALQVDDYTLPNSIEKKTPIGSKIVICKWKAEDGSEWISADLVYQTTDQLRGLTLLDMAQHPAVYSLSFAGLDKNGDGLFAAEDFMKRLTETADQYDVLKAKYGAE